MLNQKEEAVASSRESLLAADSLGPVTETTTDCSDENSRFDDTGLVTNVNSKQAPITLTQLDTQTEEQQQKEQEGPGQTSLDLATTTTTTATSTGSTDQDLHSKEEETTSQDSVVQERPAGSREEPDSEPGGAAEDANEGEAEEKEAPAATGKKSGTGKAKTTKRRSGRANRR